MKNIKIITKEQESFEAIKEFLEKKGENVFDSNKLDVEHALDNLSENGVFFETNVITIDDYLDIYSNNKDIIRKIGEMALKPDINITLITSMFYLKKFYKEFLNAGIVNVYAYESDSNDGGVDLNDFYEVLNGKFTIPKQWKAEYIGNTDDYINANIEAQYNGDISEISHNDSKPSQDINIDDVADENINIMSTIDSIDDILNGTALKQDKVSEKVEETQEKDLIIERVENQETNKVSETAKQANNNKEAVKVQENQSNQNNENTNKRNKRKKNKIKNNPNNSNHVENLHKPQMIKKVSSEIKVEPTFNKKENVKEFSEVREVVKNNNNNNSNTATISLHTYTNNNNVLGFTQKIMKETISNSHDSNKVLYILMNGHDTNIVQTNTLDVLDSLIYNNEASKELVLKAVTGSGLGFDTLSRLKGKEGNIGNINVILDLLKKDYDEIIIIGTLQVTSNIQSVDKSFIYASQDKSIADVTAIITEAQSILNNTITAKMKIKSI